MSKEKKQNLSTFLRVLWTIICQCIAYASICSRLYDEKELIRYFNHLIRARVNEFIKGRRKHPQQLKEISFYQNSIPKIIQKYKRTMREKSSIVVILLAYPLLSPSCSKELRGRKPTPKQVDRYRS